MSTVDIEQEQELLSLEDAAEFLCVSKSTMYRLLDQGKLRGMKAGKQWRFRKEDLLAYMQRGPAAQALANLPIAMLDAELAFFAEELARAGSSTEAADDPTLECEAGKITQLVRRMIGLLCARKGSDLHLEPIWGAGEEQVLLRLRIDGKLHYPGYPLKSNLAHRTGTCACQPPFLYAFPLYQQFTGKRWLREPFPGVYLRWKTLN